MSNEDKLGLFPSPWDSKRVLYAVRSATAEDMVGIPDEWDGLASIMPCLGDQGNIGSCGGWAGASLMHALIKLNDGREILPSAGSIYWHSRDYITPPPSGDGTSCLAIMKTLTKDGAAPESCSPTDTQYPFEIADCDDWRALASQYKIKIYRQVPNNPDSFKAAMWGVTWPQPYTMPDGSPGKCPLFIGVPVYTSFNSGQNGVIPLPQDGETLRGGHALAIRGWKKIGNEYYWIVVNSWGDRSGDDGIYYLPFGYPIWEGWLPTDDEPLPQPVPPEPTPPEPTPPEPGPPQPEPPAPEPEPRKSWWEKIWEFIKRIWEIFR